MNLRAKYLILAFAVLSYSGCCCGQGPGLFGGPGLFSNLNSARVAPPMSIASANPNQNRIAAAPVDPYYGQRPAATTASAANATGWRPLGTNAATAAQSNSANYSPTSYNIRNAQQNSQGSNVTVASSTTSTIRPGGGNRVASVPPAAQRPTVQVQQPAGVQLPVNTIRQNNGSAVASNSMTSGMPLNDATHLNNVQPQLASTGIFNRASEFVARPNTMAPNQYIAQPRLLNTYNGPNAVNGQLVSSSPNQFNRPAGSSFGYQNGYQNQNGYPGNYQNGYPNQNYPANVAQQWRQRNAR